MYILNRKMLAFDY
ncbi:hypothetical protein BC937DRAFT_86572 [Endogone sp. FLAS-F59071]|nr:hypothetical protein BC937DRAFT_86572 [Endogone sp. FLAS-F59071]|eukprot:RUS20010.1 hypothetical protein BC937DRAFT_86572 [Endogone sp. FLAS-F59071]